MKNLFLIFTLVTIALFTSSVNAALAPTETFLNPNIESISHIELSKNIMKESQLPSNQVQVTKVSSTITGGDLVVNFTSNANFFNADLAAVQTLVFIDSNNNESSLNFTVSGHSYSNGILQVAFSIGGNNIGGLDLKSTQYIVIDDILID